MPVVKHQVTAYKYEFRSTESENVAIVYLQSDAELVCTVAFVDSDEPLPPPQENVAGWVAVAYRYDWLRDTIDMLRNENPVFFTWSREARIARITTEEEPVGEEERRGLLSWLFG